MTCSTPSVHLTRKVISSLSSRYGTGVVSRQLCHVALVASITIFACSGVADPMTSVGCPVAASGVGEVPVSPVSKGDIVSAAVLRDFNILLAEQFFQQVNAGPQLLDLIVVVLLRNRQI